MNTEPGHDKNPAERYVALKMLEVGLGAALARARIAAHTYANKVGAKTLTTEYGPLTVTERKDTAAVDQAKLLGWSRLHRPDVVVSTIDTASPDMPTIVDWVRANYPAALKDSLDPTFVSSTAKRLKLAPRETVDADTGEVHTVAGEVDVIDTTTGEPVPYGIVKKGGGEYVTARLTDVAKDAAVIHVQAAIGALLTATAVQATPVVTAGADAPQMFVLVDEEGDDGTPDAPFRGEFDKDGLFNYFDKTVRPSEPERFVEVSAILDKIQDGDVVGFTAAAWEFGITITPKSAA